ncbi:MAG: hypothetical protein KAH54_08885 [Candidatus Sabulitectum sp.]|nr:hypothetical protein [Candidatus Sabulitectum sp.]
MRKTALTLVLITSLASAFAALPTLGYSASSGFIFGGYLLFPFADETGQVSVNTYYGTAGVIKFQPELVRTFGAGVLRSSLDYRKVIEKEWYGWGNATDPDSFASMDFEKANLLIDLTVPAGDRFFLTGGLDLRHSTVFNREESILWERLPGDVFGSTWTAGLNGKVDYLVPVPLNGDVLLSTSGFFQAGDVSYSGVTGKIRYTVRPWTDGEVALGARLHRQFNIADTPIPDVSGIGQNQNFRGYRDYRFTGPLWTLYQLEAREDLFTLGDVEAGKSLTIGVTAFAEAGEAAETFEKFTVSRLHYDYGCGLNIKLNPSAQMRIDAAWSEEGMLIQSAFGLSF